MNSLVLGGGGGGGNFGYKPMEVRTDNHKLSNGDSNYLNPLTRVGILTSDMQWGSGNLSN